MIDVTLFWNKLILFHQPQIIFYWFILLHSNCIHTSLILCMIYFSNFNHFGITCAFINASLSEIFKKNGFDFTYKIRGVHNLFFYVCKKLSWFLYTNIIIKRYTCIQPKLLNSQQLTHSQNKGNKLSNNKPYISQKTQKVILHQLLKNHNFKNLHFQRQLFIKKKKTYLSI